MKTRNSTKSKLLSSVIALVLCVSMLIGATFAWFTDAASTGVNKIQAGTLDVALEMKNAEGNWVNAEGQTLQFKKAAGATEGEQVLWEPGCTYELPELRIVNKGDLALKYKIQITGIDGSAKLNEAIDWTMNDAAINSAAEYYLAPKDKSMTIRGNNVTDTSASIVIKGTMQTSAGNEYQGLTIDGIGITVFATQVDAESDSFNNTYDQGATTEFAAAVVLNGASTPLEKSQSYTIGSATVTVDADGNISYTNSNSAQTVSITTHGGNLTVNAPNDTIYHYGTADSVTINAIKGNSFHEFGEVAVLSIAQGRVVAEKGNNIGVIQVPSAATTPVIAVPENVVLDTKIEKADTAASVKIDVIDSQGAAIEGKSFTTTDGKEETATIPEELQIVLKSDKATISNEVTSYVASVDNKPYKTLSEAVADAQSGDTVTLLQDTTGDRISITKNITIDGAGHTLTDNKTDGRAIWIDATGVTLNLVNLTIDGANKCQRGVQVNKLDSGERNYATINMDRCTLKNLTYYAINLNVNTTVDMTITNSSISGWAAINAYGTGNTIKVKNSVLEGINDKNLNSWNNFCTVCLEGDTTGQTTLGSADYNVLIENSTIIAKQTTGNRQAAVGFNANSQNSTVQLTNTEIILGDTEKCYNFYDYGTNNTIIVDGKTIGSSVAE